MNKGWLWEEVWKTQGSVWQSQQDAGRSELAEAMGKGWLQTTSQWHPGQVPRHPATLDVCMSFVHLSIVFLALYIFDSVLSTRDH